MSRSTVDNLNRNPENETMPNNPGKDSMSARLRTHAYMQEPPAATAHVMRMAAIALERLELELALAKSALEAAAPLVRRVEPGGCHVEACGKVAGKHTHPATPAVLANAARLERCRLWLERTLGGAAPTPADLALFVLEELEA